MAQIKVKHQVFISSTYVDLQEERQEAMRAVLKLNCIPAGMELFPAANEDSWSLIRRVIDDCDYYIVIVGGRYGSLMPDGVSFTEKEYDYAVERKEIPVLAFLRKSLPKSTESPEACEKLKKFRARVEQDRNPEFWSTPHELRAAVASSLAIARESIPAIGWVRGDLVPSEDLTREALNLKTENEQLRKEMDALRAQPPADVKNLAQLDEVFVIRHYKYGDNWQEVRGELSIRWGSIFRRLLPLMADQANESQLWDGVHNLLKEKTGRHLHPASSSFQTIKSQMQAWGFIALSDSPPSNADDKVTYWTLTPYGKSEMLRLCSVKKGESTDG